MDKQRETEIRLQATDDGEKPPEANLGTIFTLGMSSTSAYDPPTDPEEKTVYDHYFNKARNS